VILQRLSSLYTLSEPVRATTYPLLVAAMPVMLDSFESVTEQTDLPGIAAAADGLGSANAGLAGTRTRIDAARAANALRRIGTVWHE
jgi:hypothetical protein